jgi:hypothetical protein
MNKHLLIFSFALIWELIDYLYIEWSLLTSFSNTELFFGMLFVYLEKVIMLYLFVYIYNKLNERRD